MDGSGCNPTACPCNDSEEDTRELPDRIVSFPMNDKPVMDTVLKDMLSLRSSIQTDMMSSMHKFNKEIQAVESRVEHIDSRMGEFSGMINDLVDVRDEKEEVIEGLRTKMADMEDRSRRNNKKKRNHRVYPAR